MPFKWIVVFIVLAFPYTFLNDLIPAPLLFKLLPMLFLLLFVLSVNVTSAKTYKYFIFTALLFCAIGDYTLQWFIIGLTSFLIGHIFYIFAFRSTNEQATPRFMKIGFIIYGIAMACIVSGTLFFKNESILAIAVIAYIIVIMTMGWNAWRVGHTWAIIGALSFIASDTVLALNRFVVDIPLSHEFILITYYGAQFLLAFTVQKYDGIVRKMIQ